MRTFFMIFALLCCSTFVQASSLNKPSVIQWMDWTDDLFDIAQRQKKYVILDLEASWCYWCFTMEEKTYSDPAVIELITKSYIPVRVDQDMRPDLSRRYQKYGWPATIIFGPDGTEIAKRAGFITPADMVKLLQGIVNDPAPESAGATRHKIVLNENPILNSNTRSALLDNHYNAYDQEYGGLKLKNKFIDFDTVEFSMLKSRTGDSRNTRMARHTLDEATALIDPAWGGAYRYSSEARWNYPHFEKIMQLQGGYMRIYALAYMQYKDKKYLEAARNIERYLHDFLTGPNGAFYTSQSAELTQGKWNRTYFELNSNERFEEGIPPIDKNQYARENGWAIQGLAALYAASGEKRYLQRASNALEWVLKNRSLDGGGYRHDATDKAGPYLGDSLAMGRALIDLYGVTGERSFLGHAEKALLFIDRKFRNRVDGKDSGGYASAYAPEKAVIRPVPQIDENIALARFAILVAHYTGNKKYREIAERAMQYLTAPQIALSRITDAGILLVDHEMANDPPHITVVGTKDDVKAQSLFQKALSYPGGYKRIEWWDRSEGPLPNPDVQYPELDTAAAFACANQRCSLPVFEPEGIHEVVDMLYGIGQPSD